nr:MAG TPA_asm: hypothetical protein [Bacteriophage sp.]
MLMCADELVFQKAVIRLPSLRKQIKDGLFRHPFH